MDFWRLIFDGIGFILLDIFALWNGMFLMIEFNKCGRNRMIYDFF